MNTFWSLTWSTIVTFGLSFLFKKGKFHIDHILNCSLAGGVMIAASWDMFSFPYPAMLVGAFAGLVSVWSF